jgi:bifunctional non-homologous end joining protein LigD
MHRAAPEALKTYRAKRDFSITPEPAGSARPARGKALSFVVQKHAARRLHYDFRLELDGVLLSWAVPKGPSLDPADKRMAVRTEDHPLSYAGFEGRIPAGQYGAGKVEIWDRGRWRPEGDARAALAAGKLAFALEGDKLKGRWALVRLKPKDGERQETWLLIKQREAEAADPHADAAPLPATLAPQLALLASALPPGPEHWLFETKFDGYRVLARIEGDRIALVTRGGHDWAQRLPTLKAALAALHIGSAWLDGEIIVPGRGGGDFNALQNAFEPGASRDAVQYRLFDLPWFEGHDLRPLPLARRRELLQELLQDEPEGPLTISPLLGEGGAREAARLLATACRQGLEGLIAKRADAAYQGTRSAAWIKLKCHRRQEFVIAGYAPRSDDVSAVGSLMLAVHDAQGRLRPAGKVGTGWDRATARSLLKVLKPLRTAQAPFAGGHPDPAQTWVRPERVAEVVFGEWTPAGRIRHASFVALRDDKPAAAIQRETPMSPKTLKPQAKIPDITITHPERVIDERSGLTKLDLAHYYDRVAAPLLAELRGRPVALLRAPQGTGGPTFFQKHPGNGAIPGISVLDAALWPGHEPLMEIRTPAALMAAVQMNAVEFHTWNSRSRTLGKPDRLVFDLDPGEGVDWPQIREGAQLLRALLQELGLACGLKTSGGKGLHLVLPIAARWGDAVVKAFSRAVVEHLAQTLPQRFVAKSGPANRRGRIFVDYLRNGEGATTVAAWSARARPGLGVSMPLAWDELPSVDGAMQWTVANAPERLRQAQDPWAALAEQRQSLSGAMKRLGFDPSRAG